MVVISVGDTFMLSMSGRRAQSVLVIMALGLNLDLEASNYI